MLHHILWCVNYSYCK